MHLKRLIEASWYCKRFELVPLPLIQQCVLHMIFKKSLYINCNPYNVKLWPPLPNDNVLLLKSNKFERLIILNLFFTIPKPFSSEKICSKFHHTWFSITTIKYTNPVNQPWCKITQSPVHQSKKCSGKAIYFNLFIYAMYLFFFCNMNDFDWVSWFVCKCRIWMRTEDVATLISTFLHFFLLNDNLSLQFSIKEIKLYWP